MKSILTTLLLFSTFLSLPVNAKCAIRKKYFFKVYEICRVEVGSNQHTLTLRFLREVPGSRLADEFETSWKKYSGNSPQEKALQDTFSKWMRSQNIAEGNYLNFRFQNLNSDKASVHLEHKKENSSLGEVSGVGVLATAINDIWLGSDPVDVDIKTALLAN